MDLSGVAAVTAETWGCSRRNARDVVAAAHKDWLVATTDQEVDQRDLLFQQVGRLDVPARPKCRLVSGGRCHYDWIDDGSGR